MTSLEEYIKSKIGVVGVEELRKDLVSQGYSPIDFEPIIESVSAKKESIFTKSRLKYYGILLLVVVIALVVRMFLVNNIVESDKVYDIVTPAEPLISFNTTTYSDDPKDWYVDDKLDVEQITRGEGYFDSSSLQYLKPDAMTAFTYDGFYQGQKFDTVFSVNQTKYLEITPNLNPLDGIPQALIVEKIDNGSVMARIFVDEDWREKIVPCYIRWGTDYYNSRIFDYSNEISSGIYMDIVDDSKRFESGYSLHYGGVMVGDITDEKIVSRNINVTYVRLR